MAQLTVRQIGFIASAGVLIGLIALGTSSAGRRLAVSAARPFAAAASYISTQCSTLFGKDDSAQKLAYLETKVHTMEIQLQETNELKEQNRQLRQMMSLRTFPEWRIVRSEILTRDPVFWDLRFTIDRGETDGIAIGAAVLSGNTLIGRITAVNQHSATVDTIVSGQCRVGVSVGDGDYHGLLQGLGQLGTENAPGCIVDFLPLDTQIDPSVRIITTSGLGGFLPAGIPVAVIVPDDEGALIHEVEHARKRLYARPRESWESLRFVSVIVQK